jgi:16S rRNA (adenine1518-N6/adenine1519-N6)-dimethyltransferase
MMNNTLPPLDIPAVLRQFGLRPSKGLGQNFLVDEFVLQEIMSRAGINSQDTVLEIGPGLGSLTRHLALVAGKVVAVELDKRLFPALGSILDPFSNIQLVQGDILEIEIPALIPQNDYLVVANIPYYITSAVIRHLLESRSKPRRIILTVQKEIAERICASKKLSLLAVSVQVYGVPSIQMQIPSSSFYPVPSVDSSVVQIEISPSPSVRPGNMDTFFMLARAGFGQKRKTLRNSLAAGLHIPAAETESLLGYAGIDPQRRAETLSIPEWGILTECYLESRSR